MTDRSPRLEQIDKDEHSRSGGVTCALYAAAFALVAFGVLLLSLAVGR